MWIRAKDVLCDFCMVVCIRDKTSLAIDLCNDQAKSSGHFGVAQPHDVSA
jgi:hypothetical protein